MLRREQRIACLQTIDAPQSGRLIDLFKGIEQ